MRSADGYFEGVGGLRLNYRAWELPRARAAILIVHGFGEHCGRYEAVAHRLAAYGFSSFAFDLRGHGLSEGRRGHVKRFGAYLQDLDRFRREVHGLVDFGTPLFLLGHALGGLVAIRYLQEFDAPLRGAIIASPWLSSVRLTRLGDGVLRVLDRVMPALPLRSSINPAMLSRDAGVVLTYRDDPLVHSSITPRFIRETGAAIELAAQRRQRIRVPILFLLAGADRILSASGVSAIASDFAGRHVTTHVYADYYHEVLREPGPAEPLRDLRDWIAGRLARPRKRRGPVA